MKYIRVRTISLQEINIAINHIIAWGISDTGIYCNVLLSNGLTIETNEYEAEVTARIRANQLPQGH